MINPRLMALVKEAEGLRLIAYDDTTGKPVKRGNILTGNITVGYGRNISAVGVSPAEADMMLESDLELAEHQAAGVVGDALWSTLSDARRGAFTEMAMNMGAMRLSGFQQMLSAAHVGNWQAVHDEALKSAWATQVGGRAKRIALMLITGEWP